MDNLSSPPGYGRRYRNCFHGNQCSLLMSVPKAVTIATKGLTFDIVRQSGLLPPIHVLNSFLQCGVDDAASEIMLQWESFTLNSAEYDEFYGTCVTLMGDLAVDGLGCDWYADWFSAAAVLHATDYVAKRPITMR